MTLSSRYRALQAGPRRGPPCWVAALLALVLTGRASALNPDRDLSEYTLSTWEEGLPQNTVLALNQTRDGYLWVGTYEGLARFDGRRFVVFDRRNTPALAGGNEIFDLARDRSGRLWVATSTGVLRLEAGGLERVLGQDSLDGESIRGLAAAADALWVATSGHLFRLDGNGGLATVWKVGEQIPNSEIRSILPGVSGGVWVGFDSGEVVRLFNGQIDVFGEADGLPPRSVRALAWGPHGELWIGTMGGGLVRKLGTDVTRFGIDDGLTHDEIRCLLVDSYGVLWIGTEGGGVNRYRDGLFSALTTANGMPSDLVRSVHEGRDGSVWIGTNGGGVVALQEKRFSSLDRRDGLENDNVRAVLEDHSGTLWIGTDGGGLYRVRSRQLTRFGVEAGLTGPFVKSIHEDRRGKLWVGTGTGLSRLEGQRFVPYTTTSEGLSIGRVTVIQDDSEGTVWVGTGGGLKQLGPDGSIRDFDREQDLAHAQVNDILESSREELWVATVAGLYWITPSEVTAFTAREGLASSRVFSLFEDSEGTLWIGTNRGLSRYRDGVFRTITSEHGLADDVIFSILDDGMGHFWMSSNHGVFSVSRRELSGVVEGRAEQVESTLYGRADGMGADQCNGTSQPAAWKTTDGRLLFPTVKGLAVLDPSDSISELPPTVVIEEMIADSETVPLTERISLDPGRGVNIDFRYTGVSFRSPSQVRFRYQLVGFDRDWVAVGGRRIAHYTKVPPGSYRFQVVASRTGEAWTEVGETIAFEIRPFFFQTSWFMWTIGLLVLGLGWSAHRWRLRRVEDQRQELALLVAARTNELAAANRELQRLSVTDSLTGIANRRRLDQKLEEEWRIARRYKAPVSLLMIDIDFFKRYNDSCGHQHGDEVLKRLAVELQGSARRSGDLVARYGGEEFVIVAPRMESEEAERYAEQIRKRIEQAAVPHPSSMIGDRITVSVGVATLRPSEGGSPEELVRHADRALYRAKRRGRNRTAQAGPTALPNTPSSPEPS